jgi:Lytic transglycolase
VTGTLAQRLIALGAVALLVGAAALAFLTLRGGSSTSHPRPVQWYSALAAPYTPPARTSCGVRTNARTPGVAHPVLACGAKLYVSFGGKEVLTQVIDRGTQVPGREFDLTTATANSLGVHGTQRIRWAFAR